MLLTTPHLRHHVDLLHLPIADLLGTRIHGPGEGRTFMAPAGRPGVLARPDAPVVVVPIFSAPPAHAGAALTTLSRIQDASPTFRPVVYTDVDVIQGVRKLGWALEHHFREGAWPGGPAGWAQHVTDRGHEIALRYGAIGFAPARTDLDGYGLRSALEGLGIEVGVTEVETESPVSPQAGADGGTVDGFRGWLPAALAEGGRRVVSGYDSEVDVEISPGGQDVWWVGRGDAGPPVDMLLAHGIGRVSLTCVRGADDLDPAVRCVRAGIGENAVMVVATTGDGREERTRVSRLGADYHAACESEGAVALHALDPGLAAADDALDLQTLVIHAAIRRELSALGISGRWAS